MISSQMKPYILYENKPTRDADGHVEDNYIPVCELMAAVNFISMNQVSLDVKYKDCRFTGLTVHKGFDSKKAYKMIPKKQHSPEYIIKSINEFTRLTQLLMQEVIT